MKEPAATSRIWFLGFFILVSILFGAKMLFVAKHPKPQSAMAYGTVPEFTLINQKGAPINLEKDLKGKVWIADFIFTRCAGVCPVMSGKMKTIARDLPQPDFRFVSFSVDPEYDTPQVLAKYAARYEADPRWFFLTGAKKELYELTQRYFRLGVAENSAEDMQASGQAVMHSSKFVLIDREGGIRGYYDSESGNFPAMLLKEAQTLLEESDGNLKASRA